MKKYFRAFLALLLTVSFLTGVTPVLAQEIDYTCGENLTWLLDAETKTLTIAGTGKMRNFNSSGSTAAPWLGFSSSIESVVVEDGVASIGDYAFYSCNSIKTAVIGEGVRAIGRYAFHYCSTLQSLALPSTLREIDQQALCYTNSLRSITFPNGCGLLWVSPKLFKPGTTTNSSLWYNSQSNGCVYLGDVLFDYKGTMPANTTLRVREGTRVILADFHDQTNLVGLDIPDSVFSIGGYDSGSLGTFDGTTWLQDQQQTAQGMIYAGKVAYRFNGTMQAGQEIELAEGTTGIAAYTFSGLSLLSKLILPSSLICIQRCGIENCKNLQAPDLSHVQYFYAYSVNLFSETLTVPASLRWAQAFAFSLSFKTRQIVFEDQAVLTELPYRVLYDGNATSSTAYIQLADNLEKLNAESFLLNGLQKIMIPPSVQVIEPKFAYQTNTGEIKPTIQCFRGSYAHTFALENDYPFELLDDTALNTDALNEQLAAAQAVQRELYTEASLSTLDAAVAAVSLGAQTAQTTVDAWAAAIQRAIGGLVYKPADYTAVNAQLQAAQELDRDLYTSRSLQSIDDAIASIDWLLPIVRQNEVDGYAQAIAAAIQAAVYRPADYGRVTEAVQAAQNVERVLYSASSLAVLDMAVSSVVYGLDVTCQAQVDAYAAQIDLAVSGLTYCSVVLRNEPHGVLVSATAKEIHPETQLAVDEIDPSVFEIADFAVGGHIKSVRYYDITLLRQAQIVQPNGTVEVKVRLSDGVDPAKCRVYHVTEDLVDPLVRVASSLDGNYIVFYADHFSEYAVVEVETVLERVAVTALPQKVLIPVGKTFASDGLQVTAYFSDGTQQVVTDYDLSAVDTSSVGEKTVSVYYTFNGITRSDQFTVLVTAETAARVEITVDGAPTQYFDKRVRLFQPYAKESVSLKCKTTANESVRIEWSSNNTKVRVDENGTVTNKGWFGARKAIITAIVTNGAGKVIGRAQITVRFYKFGFQLRRLEKQETVYLPNDLGDYLFL